MYAITGAFGQTGQALCHTLLAQGHPVRMLVRRDDGEASAWRARGAEVRVADLLDTSALARAFEGAQAAYLMNPPAYFADDLYAQARAVHTSLVAAAAMARVPHVVGLSSIGAQHARGTGNILTTHDLEQRLAAYPGRVTLLRAANFMENWAWSFDSVRQRGVLPSMFRPLERAVPMVSAQDVGATAAALLQAPGTVQRHIVELWGEDSSPHDAARVLSALHGRPVQAVQADPAEWAAAMRGQGFPAATVTAFVKLFEGFNTGHTRFEGTHETRRGTTTLQQALAAVWA
ncbi:NmrA family NAD(P)-binding protein [Pseudorhodoferax sp. Leaf267]|uniref:NmrA family NAD(P)-binding protein n=1 Tax=Pseudorhodoferax sp. Leaf267 TaxID=1736316 RepID=UPI0007014AA7|nr:NmrA family NAD(P)-binding protein [Pseudorhodoferax sp. Leaf267]KQP18231.1 hypothetical protein ASF43_10400 [Pseudorhodoferax sp. Leaf267]